MSKSVVMVANRTLEIRSIPVPDELPPGYALLKVEGNGICGSDYDMYVGALESSGAVTYPCIPGHEMVGTIVKSNAAAERDMGVSEGQFVAVEPLVRCGHCRPCSVGGGNVCQHAFYYSVAPLDLQPFNGLTGGMSEYMVLGPGTRVFPLSSDVSIEDAVLFNPLGNGIEWVCNVGGVRLGDRVLILGAGQRGIACALAAKEVGASQIIVTGLGRDEHKLEVVREFGATHVIDVEAEDLHSRVAEITGGEGVDVALDLVPDMVGPTNDALELLRPGGTLVVAGVKGKALVEVNLDRFIHKAIRVEGVMGVAAWSTMQAIRIIEEGRYPFERLHSHTFGLEQVDLAIRMLGSEIPGDHPIHMTIKPQSSSV